jgi:hypothetical protein
MQEFEYVKQEKLHFQLDYENRKVKQQKDDLVVQ